MSQKFKQATINIKGIISSTSDKQGKLKLKEGEIPTKSIYITVDEKTATKLKAMNLVEYSTKEGNIPFFILAVGSNGIKKYGKDKEITYLETVASRENPNFSSEEKEVELSLLYAQTDQNATGTYVRLTAINDPEEHVKLVEDVDPFAMTDEEIGFDDLPF